MSIIKSSNSLTTAEIARRLAKLREELAEGESLASMQVTAGFFLADVCAFLDLSEAETAEALGGELSEAVKAA